MIRVSGTLGQTIKVQELHRLHNSAELAAVGIHGRETTVLTNDMTGFLPCAAKRWYAGFAVGAGAAEKIERLRYPKPKDVKPLRTSYV